MSQYFLLFFGSRSRGGHSYYRFVSNYILNSFTNCSCTAADSIHISQVQTLNLGWANWVTLNTAPSFLNALALFALPPECTSALSLFLAFLSLSAFRRIKRHKKVSLIVSSRNWTRRVVVCPGKWGPRTDAEANLLSRSVVRSFSAVVGRRPNGSLGLSLNDYSIPSDHIG